MIADSDSRFANMSDSSFERFERIAKDVEPIRWMSFLPRLLSEAALRNVPGESEVLRVSRKLPRRITQAGDSAAFKDLGPAVSNNRGYTRHLSRQSDSKWLYVL